MNTWPMRILHLWISPGRNYGWFLRSASDGIILFWMMPQADFHRLTALNTWSLTWRFLRLTTSGSRNGTGTAIVMIIIGLLFWISSGILESSEWNIFLNPFDLPDEISETIWETVVNKNRIYLLCGTILSILYGLFNLQKREKFI